MKRMKLYRVLLPDSERYQGRMEKLEHYVHAYSPEQALAFVLAVRNLKPLYEEWKEMMKTGLVRVEKIGPPKIDIPEKEQKEREPYQLRLFE